jgi:hypothetical protein
MEHLRWVAVVTYRSESGPIEVDHHFEELEELSRLIERGPDWNTIVSIVVTLNPERATYPTTPSRLAFEFRQRGLSLGAEDASRGRDAG